MVADLSRVTCCWHVTEENLMKVSRGLKILLIAGLVLAELSISIHVNVNVIAAPLHNGLSTMSEKL